jgi:3-deoxy-D-manno-octulosonate 8-phosphate phosphatase KdsC-like HAD superfamily phosphatase
MSETLEELQDKVSKLEKDLAFSESIRSMYENGDAKLYYSLQRKMSEMSKIFNSQDLSAIDMASKSDATFERVFKLLEKCEIVSKSAESLGAIAGVTGNEKKDVERRPFIEMVATKRD